MQCPRAGSSGQSLVRELARASWLPFLYHTKTILRRSYAVDAIGGTEHVEQKKKKRLPDGRRAIRRKSLNPDGRPLHLKGLGDHGGVRHGDGEAFRTQTDHVPFERSSGSINPLQKLEGSTMTPREMEVFKRLLSKTTEAQTVDIGPGARRENSTARAIDNLGTHTESLQSLRPLIDESKISRALGVVNASSKKQDQRSGIGSQLSSGAREYLAQTRKAMDAAQNEAILWDVLQTKVFQKIESLELESSHRPSNAMMRDLNILTATLPSVLLHFMTTIANSFPRSPLGIMLMPALKKRGPSAFALGATTGLFNHHMEFLYRQYSDLDAIADTLAEMDKNVYNFNWDTSALLASIFEAANAANNDQAGPALKALWATDRRQRALKKLREWDKMVVERLHADALRRANEKELLDDDDMEESGDSPGKNA